MTPNDHESRAKNQLRSAVAWFANRYRVLLLRRAIGRSFEVLRYSMVRPQRTKRFHIVSAQRNMGEVALRCLQSVYDQKCPSDLVRHVFIDDASTDDTVPRVEAWLHDHPNHHVEFIRNHERQGMLANNLKGFQLAEEFSIGIELNGDDWLPDSGVLAFLDKVYDDDDVWMTYNTLRQSDGTLLFQVPPSRDLRRSLAYRRAPWLTSHLHTFRIGLYHLVPTSLLTDPETGELWDLSQDMAVYISMLEMAGGHARHIYRVTCTYHPHPMSDHIRDEGAQNEAAERIRSLPPRRPLQRLDDDHHEIR